MKKLLLLISVLLFSQNLSSQVTVITPNGGESFVAGTIDTIRWQASSVTFVNIEYTTDNGMNWTFLAESVSSVFPAYSWTIPNFISSMCKVKITDAMYAAYSDESDTPFSIVDQLMPALTLLYPNGGEIIYNGSQQNITWSSSNVSFVNLYFSPNNGETWNLLASNISAASGSYLSAVNSSSTTNALIRISDASNAQVFDECNQVFTIIDTTSPKIQVTFPNGGETFAIGSVMNIVWTSTVLSGTSNIEYSIDNGISWNSIANNMPSSSPSYMWYIQSAISSNCKIRVYDTANPSINDESDNVFSIIDMAIGGGAVAHYKFDGDALDASGNGLNGTVYGTTALVEDRFFKPNSAYSFYDNSSIKVPHSPKLNFSGQFTFAVWMNQAGGISAFNCILGKDYTKEFGFGTWGTGCQEPTYPRLIVGNVETQTSTLSPITCFTWTHVAVTFDDAKDEVKFYINGVLTETLTNTGTITPTSTPLGIGEDGFYVDQFYGVLDDIRIFDKVLTATEIDAIYNDKGVNIKSLKVGYPNGGDLLTSGTIDTIRWTSSYATLIKLDYTTDDGVSWTNIISDLPAQSPTGYPWIIPTLASTMCRVRVTDVNDPTVADQSDTLFTIQLHKSAEYAWDANTILLDHFNEVTDASIAAFREIGGPCGTESPAATPNYSYNFGLNEFNYALNLDAPIGEPQGSSTYLKYPGGQVLSQPNGTIEFMVYLTTYAKGLSLVEQGQFFRACSGWTFSLHIDSTGMLNSSAWAAFSLNSGDTKIPLNKWTHLAVTWGSTGAKLYIDGRLVGSDTNTGMPAPYYGGSLLIPLGTGAGVSSSIDELRVSNIQRTEFHIVPQQSLTVTSPNGGEHLVTGKIDTIRWMNASGGYLNIDYTTDNGTNWISIYPAMPASVGSTPWLIPNTVSTNCRVRITDVANPSIFDISDNVFTIESQFSFGLVAHYPFNGNANDESGNGNNGTVNGSTLTTDRFGNPNSALAFDGNNNYVFVPSSPSLNMQNSITLVSWVKTDNPHLILDDNPGAIIAKHETVSTRQYDLFFYSGIYDSIVFHVVDQKDYYPPDEYIFPLSTPSAAYRNNQWHMVVGTYDFATGLQNIYIDGLLSSFQNLGPVTLKQTGVPVTIGCYSLGAESFRGFFHGILDDIRIYNRALTPDEVSLLYHEKEYVPTWVNLLTPNGGEKFQPNTPVYIEWNAVNIGTFNLEYTSDNGTTWNLICDTLTNASSAFLWYTPFIESDLMRIRISDKLNANTFDESDSNFTVTNKITQHIPLYYSGWNMISFYVQPVSSEPRYVFPTPPVLQVKTELQSFDPALPEFLNTLKSVNASQGYLVKTDSAERAFQVKGDPFYPADGINYRAGWNLMSYYYSYGESIWYAFEPIMNSVEEIKTLTGYFNPLGSEITNTLYSLEPGEAYWLRLKNNVDGYVLPSPQAIMPKKHQTAGQKLIADLPWKLKGYPQSTVAIFTVTSNGEPVNEGSVVAAFVNNECRAISEVKLNKEGTAFATLVINGDKEEEVSFKIYDAAKKEAFGSNMKMKTKPGTTIPGIQELRFTFVTGIEDPILPTTTTLMNAYPNPFNPDTRIRYSLNKDQHVSLKIYDVLGKEVITLVDDTKNAGYYEVSFDASGLPSGIYFYRMQSGEYVSVKKLLLLK